MTIYMVEHLFARPDWEAGCNAWYEKNMSVLQAPPQTLPANAMCYRAISVQHGPLYRV